MWTKNRKHGIWRSLLTKITDNDNWKNRSSREIFQISIRKCPFADQSEKEQEPRNNYAETMYNYNQEAQENQIQVLNSVNIKNKQKISNVKENPPNGEHRITRVEIFRKQEFKTKETNGIMNIHGKEENSNL